MGFGQIFTLAIRPCSPLWTQHNDNQRTGTVTAPDHISGPDSLPDAVAPVLLFDSGVGGLTVLRALRALLPQAPVIYAADTAGAVRAMSCVSRK